jgi:protein-disulfide isomerase
MVGCSRSFAFKTALDVTASVVLIAAAVVLVVVSLSIRQSRSEPPNIPDRPISIAGVTTRGSPEAPVVVVMFSDFQCPYCGQLARDVLPVLLERYVDRGIAMLAFVHMPLPNHPRAVDAAVAVECAGEQGQFWPMHDALFARGETLAPESIQARAEFLGLDQRAFERCAGGGVRSRVQEQIQLATSLGVAATPTLFVGLAQPDSTVRVTAVLKGLPSRDGVQGAVSAALEPTSSSQTEWWVLGGITVGALTVFGWRSRRRQRPRQ